MKSFRDPITGILKAAGHVESNDDGDLSRDEPEGFALTPGQWMLVGDAWEPVQGLWRAPAMVDLRMRRDRLLDVISGMQADYITTGDSASAGLCLTVKQQLKDLPTRPELAAATTREQFNAVVIFLWKQMAAPAPVAVRAEFARYAGDTD